MSASAMPEPRPSEAIGDTPSIDAPDALSVAPVVPPTPAAAEGDGADASEFMSESSPEVRAITMKKPAIKPELGRAPSVDARTLKAWLDRGHDDAGRPVVMLDTRNAFEIDVGTFDDALDYRIDKFSEFPEVIDANRADLEGKTVVSFCTGGIRCEKAAIHMKEIGIENVYQLEGGILKYFEEVGGAHYHGDCFVFDYRTALNPQLQPTENVTCFACRAVVTPEAQQSPSYVPGQSCPACAQAASAA